MRWHCWWGIICIATVALVSILSILAHYLIYSIWPDDGCVVKSKHIAAIGFALESEPFRSQRTQALETGPLLPIL
jgi:hypothetical protein